MPTKDPLSLVYETLNTMLWANTRLAAMVPAGNRIAYTGTDRDPTKPSMQPADFPQVSIEADDGVLQLGRSSNGTSLLLKYRVLVMTGDKRLCYLNPAGTAYCGLFPLMWEITRSLANWDTHLKALNWGTELGFVKACDLTLHHERIGHTDWERQKDPPNRKDGWCVAWEGSVDMWFSNNALP